MTNNKFQSDKQPSFNDKVSKSIFILCSYILVLLFGLFLGYYSHTPTEGLEELKRPIAFISRFPFTVKSDSKEVVTTLMGKHRELLYADYFPGKSGITKSTDKIQAGYLLISRLSSKEDQCIIELMNKRTGEIIRTWVPSYEDIYKKDDKPLSEDDAKSPFHMRVIHPLLLEDGSLIFHTTGGRLVRLDKHSNVMWQIKHFFHHSINIDHEGNIWVPSEMKPSRYKLHGISIEKMERYSPDKISVQEESLVKISQDGEILNEISLPKILLDNGLKGTFIYKWTEKIHDDVMHLNDIEPVLEDTNFAKKGDLFLSMRSNNLVLQYRPSENKIIWHKIGPWIAQHDVTIDNMNEISILSNDRPLEPYDKSNRSRVITFNFATGIAYEPYKESTEASDFFVWSQGLQTVLPNGNVLLEETMKGRILELSKNSIEWEYINRYDDKYLGNLAWSRFIPEEDIDLKVFKKSEEL